MAAAAVQATGRWTDEEHAFFEEGLRRFGTNWRMIQQLVCLQVLGRSVTRASGARSRLALSAARLSSRDEVPALASELAIYMLLIF